MSHPSALSRLTLVNLSIRLYPVVIRGRQPPPERSHGCIISKDFKETNKASEKSKKDFNRQKTKDFNETRAEQEVRRDIWGQQLMKFKRLYTDKSGQGNIPY
uniref:Uncharacterized protein n=1 Tax=Steinernema glaseri TaxID=37863 RepID=A0A1I8AUL0_9BILA